MIKFFSSRLSLFQVLSVKSTSRLTQKMMSSTNKPKQLQVAINNDTTYPVIPKVKYLLPLLNRQPHHQWLDMLGYTKKWLLSIADRSVDQTIVRPVIESQLGRGLIEAATFYFAFPMAGHNDYRLINDVFKELIFLVVLDGFLAENVGQKTDQLLCDYINESITENWHHDPVKDNKRPFLMNLYGHAVSGWRRAGLTRYQEIRMINGFRNYITMNLDGKDKLFNSVEKPVIGLDNYLVERGKDGFTDALTILKERMVNVNLTPDIVNHPDISRIVLLGDGIVCLANDLATYFRERASSDSDLTFYYNYITVVKNQIGLSEQEAVNKGCDYLVSLHRELADKIKTVIRSNLCKKHPEVELWLTYVYPTTVYGLCQASDCISRARLDGRTRFDWDDEEGDDEMFYNDTDPRNYGKKFEWPLESIQPDDYKTMERLS